MTQPEDVGRVTVEYSKPDGLVANLLLDREDKLNAITLEMLEELQRVCAEVESSAARVVVLRTAGEKVFSVGADINHFSALDPVDMWRTWVSTGHRALNEFASLRQPTIAVVDGLAFGGGLELVLSADFRVLSSVAKVSFPETGLGTVPGWGGTRRLTDLVGVHRASELIMTRRILTAPEALSWGIATRVSDSESTEGTVQSLVEELLDGAPIAVQLAKQLIRAATEDTSNAVLEALAAGVTAATGDLSEGVASFREKRRPRFNDS
jgi:enoyl-CoA hydratase